MRQNRLGKTDALPSQALDAGAKGQVFPFNLLHENLTYSMHFRIEMTCVCAPFICVKARDPKGLEESLQL